ncbi:MAG: CHRD domain-containing protein [Balneolaceae bacterium]|nr:CHRD domain-containing protein [Balneolaceae bacterium]
MGRAIRYSMLGLFCIALFGCSDYGTTAIEKGAALDQEPKAINNRMHGPANIQRNYRTHLSGKTEVPEPVDTKAQGEAIFKLSKDGSYISYKLIVANIENVFMAHIHLAPEGVNGPVGVWLYPGDGPPPQLIEGTTNGILAEGVIMVDDLTGPLAGNDSLEQLLDAMQNGGAYVNVHTTQNPAGEIRGQIF